MPQYYRLSIQRDCPLDFIRPFLAMTMPEQAHHCSSGLTKTFTCVQLSNTYLSATLTTTTFPTAAACRGFDACACTPTPRDLLSFHWQLRLHLIWKVANPFIYRCAPRGTRTGTLTLFSGSMYFPSDPQPWQLQLLRRIALIPIDFSNYFILIC